MNGVIESKLGYELFRRQWIHDPSYCLVSVEVLMMKRMLS